MQNKYIALSIFVALLFGAAIGRYTVPLIKTTKTDTVIVEQKKQVTNTDKDKKVKTVITETTRPDGTKEKKTEIQEDTQTVRVTKNDENKNTQEHSATSVIANRAGLALGVTAGTDPTKSLGNYCYGGYLQKNVLGPIAIGAYGNTCKQYGLSLGLTF